MPPSRKRKRRLSQCEGDLDGNRTNDESFDRSVRSLRSSRSSAAVSETTKQYLRVRYQDRCWLCGLLGTDVAHVYPKADDTVVRAITCDPIPCCCWQLLLTSLPQFREWKSLGVIRADSIHSLDNLLLLCATCHRAFDRRIPAWTFLPSDMDALIAEEEEFHIACMTNTSGKPPSRPSCPTIPYLSYTRYLVRDENPAHIAPIGVVQKRWMGDPALTVTRNASILGAPKPTKYLAAVFPKLIRLLDLYRSAPTAGIENEVAQSTTLIGKDDDEGEGHADKYDGPASDAGVNQGKGRDVAGTRKVGKGANRSPRGKADDVTREAGERADRPPDPRCDQEPFDRTTKPLAMKQSMARSGGLRCKKQRRTRRTIDCPEVATTNEGKVCALPVWAFGPSWTANKIGHYLRACD